MQLCDYLIGYLQKTFQASESSSTNPGPSKAAGTSDLPDNGLKVLQRDLGDYYVVNTSKRGKKKGGNNSKKDTIVHSVDTLDCFSKLEISPPITVSTVPAAIDALRAKKEMYQNTARGAIPSFADKSKAAAAAASSTANKKDKRGLGFNLENDFPQLKVTAAPTSASASVSVPAAAEISSASTVVSTVSSTSKSVMINEHGVQESAQSDTA